MGDTELWYGTSGPRDAKIVLVAESWGAEEEVQKRPLVGQSGVEMNRMLAEAGIQRDDVLCTNVIAERPPNNEMWRFFHAKAAPSGRPFIGGLDPRNNVLDGLRQLYDQINSHPRSLVIACGNYALWALSNCTGTKVVAESNGRKIPSELQPYGPTGIDSWRGSMWYVLRDRFTDRGYSSTPLLPIYHPAAILRTWSWRATTVHDLRARVRQALAGDWRPRFSPVFWAPPTFEQAVTKLRNWLRLADGGVTLTLAEDTETARGWITCLGLADSPHFAMSIPFIRKQADGSFSSWWTPDQEAQIIQLIRRVNRHPQIRIVGQNFIYDTQYEQHHLAHTPILSFDTMLAQNVLFPGTPKALDYLSSLYCRYHWYWKEDHKEWDESGTIEDLLRYNCWDCVRTWEIAQAQEKEIVQSCMEEQWTLKMRINDLCLRMMNRGVRVDKQRRVRLSIELHDSIERLHSEILRIVPQTIADPAYPQSKHDAIYTKKGALRKNGKYVYWYKSAKQCREVLNEKLGFPVVRDRKTGSVTTGKEARQSWEKSHPIWKPLITRLSQYESLDNTYTVINMRLDADDRARSSFNPGGTETHRLSSSKNVRGGGTNFQNLSKGKDDDD